MKKITIGTLTLCFALGLAANDDIETARIKNDNSFDEVLGYWNANEGMMQKRPGGEIKKRRTEEAVPACRSRIRTRAFPRFIPVR